MADYTCTNQLDPLRPQFSYLQRCQKQLSLWHHQDFNRQHETIDVSVCDGMYLSSSALNVTIVPRVMGSQDMYTFKRYSLWTCLCPWQGLLAVQGLYILDYSTFFPPPLLLHRSPLLLIHDTSPSLYTHHYFQHVGKPATYTDPSLVSPLTLLQEPQEQRVLRLLAERNGQPVQPSILVSRICVWNCSGDVPSNKRTVDCFFYFAHHCRYPKLECHVYLDEYHVSNFTSEGQISARFESWGREDDMRTNWGVMMNDQFLDKDLANPFYSAMDYEIHGQCEIHTVNWWFMTLHVGNPLTMFLGSVFTAGTYLKMAFEDHFPSLLACSKQWRPCE